MITDVAGASVLVPRLCGQPGAAVIVRFGIQLGQRPSQTRATPERKALVVDNAEGEAGKDWRQGRDPRALFDCQIRED